MIKRSKTTAIADVAPPGSSLPSGNSRSVAPHRTIVRDPMTVAPDPAATPDLLGESANVTHRTGVHIEPLQGADRQAALSTPAVKAENPTDLQKEEQEEITAEAEKALAKDVAALAAEKALAYEAEIDSLIASKKYALPISPSRAHRTGRWVLVAVVLLLALAAAGYYYYTYVL